LLENAAGQVSILAGVDDIKTATENGNASAASVQGAAVSDGIYSLSQTADNGNLVMCQVGNDFFSHLSSVYGSPACADHGEAPFILWEQ
jgi:hypothetical protein